ncbi:hypothetical protein V8F33_013455 [Rhypophila sp. PSN 637]
MPSIMSMPAELAIMIVENVVSLEDLSAIGRTCRRYHDIADPVLYQRALADSDWEVDLLLWAIEKICPQTLAKALSAGFNPDIGVEIRLSHREWKRGETRFWRRSRQRIDARSHSVVPRLVLNFTSTYDTDVENHDRYQRAPVRGVPEITPEDRAGMEDRASDQWANEINDAHPRRINRTNGHWDTAAPYLIAQGADPNPEVSYKLYDLDSGPNPPDNTSNGTPSRDEYGVIISLLAELCRVGRFEDASKLFDRMDASVIKNLTGPRVSKNPDPSDDPPSSTDPDSTSFVIPLLHICCMQPLRDSRRIFLPMGDMPLEDMRERWQPVILKKLIGTVGSDVNSPWGLGEEPESTPLMVAARHGCLTAIKALLGLGANVRIRNQQGRNPVMLAMMQRARYDNSSVSSDNYTRPNIDVLDPEFTEMPFLPSSMTRIPLCQLISILDLLLASGIPVNEEDRGGMTALHFFFHGPPPQRFVPVYKHTLSWYHLLDNRYHHLDREEGRLLKYVLNRGADPTVNAGVRDRSVLWTVFAGPWSSACGILLSSRFGPDIIRFFENNPDQLRDMFLHVVEQHAAANPSSWPAPFIQCFVESLERLLDMDHSERLTYDTRLLFQLLGAKWKNAHAPRWAARCLAQRMVDSGRLEFETPSKATSLFQLAVSRSAWHLASNLISHVDLACEGPATIAVISSLATTTVTPGSFAGPHPMHREVGLWDFITRVVDAGFDVHWRPPADKIHVEYTVQYQAGYQTKSLLSWAIFRRWAPLVEFMLNRQPIHESATAAESTYLHEVFSAHVMFKPRSHGGSGYNYRPTFDDSRGHSQDVRILNDIIGALLASGADTTAKNSEGQLPIDVLKAGLLEHQQEPHPYNIWFERLTRHLNNSDESKSDGLVQAAAGYYDETSSEGESES